MSTAWLAAGSSKDSEVLPAWTTWSVGTSISVAGSGPIPHGATITEVALVVSASSGVTAITLWLSHDAAGLLPLSPFAPDTATQTLSDLGGGVGAVVFQLDALYCKQDGLYVHARADAGDFTAHPQVYAELP